jgi:DNA-binding NtrC family response regulator
LSLTILVCDDDDLLRRAIGLRLSALGHHVLEVGDGEACVQAVVQHAPDVVLLDLHMPHMDGLTTLRRLRDAEVQVPVLVMTAFGAIDSAIEATRLGAAAYLPKPLNLEELSLQIDKVLQHQQLALEVSLLKEQRKQGYGKLVGQSAPMNTVFAQLRRLEAVNAPTVLINGESGTGKDLVAQAIHSQGPRRDALFMEVDCASLPEPLIESTLFGHEKGAFTDARTLKRGLFEVAKGGTIFLDEIGEMSLQTQAKLLRALENRRFKRVGGTTDLPLEAAIIAATNRDLREEVAQKRFREDLYFRLNVIPIMVPPLRERSTDIPLLIEHLLTRFNKELGRKVAHIDDDAMEALVSYAWPGNVRELRNVIERMVILEAHDDVIRARYLPEEIRRALPHAPSGVPLGVPPDVAGLPLSTVPGASVSGVSVVVGDGYVLPPEGVDLERLELSLLHQALAMSVGNRSRAARLLGISRHALRYRIQKAGIADEGDAAG